MNFRIGEGWGTHALVEGRKLIIGGVEIPTTRGCWATPDTDVLLHAHHRRHFGRSGLGDVGRHFPDTAG